MKFLCDRCKTRYSIGDDRVRGKILKIRCKNCANVITVREGMTDVDAADPAARRGKTTNIPPIEGAQPQNGALGAAFANALTTKPPAALEEEWYVSIDGEQAGPFSLSDAQRWVASKAYEADLHCWSEGFDDWLPVDKVSHFRGLRKKPMAPPIPSTPPPMPRAPGLGASRMAAPAQTQKIDESEPKPLFAATMASLERGAPPTSSPGFSLPSLNGNATARATPPGGHGAIPTIAKPANGALAPKPIAPAPIAPIAPPAITPAPSAPPIPSTNVSAKGTSAKNAFDVGDQATMIESPAFPDEADKKRDDIAASAAAASVEKTPAPPAATFDASTDDDDDDDLQIGEVSRVVKLADLMAAKPKRAESISTAPATLANRGSVPRLGNTGAVPRLSAPGAVARIDDPNAAALGANPMLADQPAELTVAPAVQATHRKGLFVLIAVATLLLAGGVAAVLMLVGGEDSGITTLGRSDTIDTTRPDDPNRPRNTPEDPKTQGSAENPFFPTTKPNTTTTTTKPKTTTNTNTSLDPEPGGPRISGDDVEAMARSQSSTTQRCYMRAQRGADAILIGDVKKINVTIEIATDGTIKTVGLSEHADNTLGKCLISAIKAWKFRASPGGTYRFALVFSAG